MVMQLQLPATCSVQLVRDVVAERAFGKNAAFFASIRDEWVARVEAFVIHQGSPAHVPKWTAIPEARHNSFLNLYLRPKVGSAQGLMLSTLRDRTLTLCPACGEAGTPNTLDHYLPKTVYPHFCITPANLFPMCDICQGQKLEKTGSHAEPRFFLHPYFDVFVAEQVLKLDIEPPFETPTFLLRPSPHLDATQQALVSSHVRELAIVQRFGHFFKERHIRTLRVADSLRQVGSEVEPTLRAIELSYRRPTLNSWEHVYLSAVVDNPDLIDYLANGVLPPNL